MNADKHLQRQQACPCNMSHHSLECCLQERFQAARLHVTRRTQGALRCLKNRCIIMGSTINLGTGLCKLLYDFNAQACGDRGESRDCVCSFSFSLSLSPPLFLSCCLSLSLSLPRSLVRSYNINMHIHMCVYAHTHGKIAQNIECNTYTETIIRTYDTYA